MTLSQTEYRNALIDAAEVGAEKALIEIGAKSPVIKRTEAERTYNKRLIATLIKAELIEPFQSTHPRGVRLYVG